MTKHDDRLVKEAQSMTAGVTATKLETGATIDLHGHTTTIIATDSAITIVQYANKSSRVYDTPILNGYLDLETFPVDSQFTRPAGGGDRIDQAWIKAVTGDCCYQVFIVDNEGNSKQVTFSYADLVEWHMTGPHNPPELNMVEGTQLYVPKKPNMPAYPQSTSTTVNEDEDNLNEEANRIIAALEAADEDSNPFETELQKRVEELTKENHALKADLLRQHDQHVTEFLAKNAEIARLEAKAAILNPGTTHKEVETLSQKVGNPEARRTADLELSDKLSDNWVALNITVADDFSMRQIILSRDLPAEQPKVRLHADEVAYHIGAVPLAPRPPVRQPPMPAGQVIMGNQSVSRALTHNGPKPGDTKRIPTLAELQQRKADDAAEIDAIMQRGRDEQEALRRQFSQSPKFPLVTGAQPS